MNISVQFSTSKITNIIDISTKIMKFKKKNESRKSWIAKNLMMSCRTKINLYKQSKLNPYNPIIKNNYTRYKNNLLSYLKNAKK